MNFKLHALLQWLSQLCFPIVLETQPITTFTSISGKEIEIFTSKLEHLIKFAENIDGKWHYWLAPHPGFG